jgi:hypothetical protein
MKIDGYKLTYIKTQYKNKFTVWLKLCKDMNIQSYIIDSLKVMDHERIRGISSYFAEFL